MFPYPIATPQKCDIQTFYGGSKGSSYQFVWNKPVGVSHVYMMLIGAGGDGSSQGNSGGSGAVTVWYGAAQHVPNILRVTFGSAASAVAPMFNLSSILTASNSTGTPGGTATTAGPFAASGFYNSTAGQDGVASSQSPSSTTFLSSGASISTVANANYGYKNAGSSAATAATGFFQIQPIIVGVGGSGAFNGGIGCGGGGSNNNVDRGFGGPGMVLIASW